MQCLTCKTEVPETSRFCNGCGKPVSASGEMATVAIENGTAHGASGIVLPGTPMSSGGFITSSSDEDEGRFLPGTLIAERYRITAMIGRGGMGEVYRATDLKLAQPVALKFLPEALSQDPKSLQRFYNEVRIARQISHQNVCRVYDIGEISGMAYISMEFIHGEDLGSLLKRIGRLPTDKALQMSRQLCAGLAAAHEKGVLHRDLKPANVMIDAEGALRVMDFGLAGLAEQVASDVRSGTPAYMAPEQLSGKEVTAKSDIYSLGLVLYEMFTGKRPFNAGSLDELQQLQAQSNPLSLVTQIADLDPSVERVIFRCLSAEPKDRPANALAVAHALPGGDPLAAAIAAGETPSPELVAAAASSSGLLPIWLALTCVVLVVIAFFSAAAMADRVTYIGAAHIEHSPEYFAQNLRDMLTQEGYDVKPFDHAMGFDYDRDFIRYYTEHSADTNRWANISGLRPGPLQFWYRESPVNMQGLILGFTRGIGLYDPPQVMSGQITVVTDVKGRLLSLQAVPPQRDESMPSAEVMSWDALFDAAGLDQSKFVKTDPHWAPLAGWDAREAWKGPMDGAEVRVEAAAWRGKPIEFQVIGPWTRPGRQERAVISTARRNQGIFLFVVAAFLVAGVLFFVRANMQAGRGDRKGAFRLGLFVFITSMFSLMLIGHHTTGIQELTFIVKCLASSSFVGTLVWILYLAMEPPIRKRWPQTMISWSRALAGNWNDPLVASHLLLGLGAGALLVMAGIYGTFLNIPYGDVLADSYMGTLLGIRHAIGGLGQLLVVAPASAMQSLFLLFLFRILLRKDWLTAVVYVLVLESLAVFSDGNRLLQMATTLLAGSLFALTMLRFGLLATMAMVFTQFLLLQYPLTMELGSWYGDLTLLTGLIMIGSTAYLYRVAMNGRRVFNVN